jgi:aryl-alcohol dehydrogenase-like predicted oxidoreductase
VRYVDVGGVRLSAIGLGTWQFGSTEWGYGEAYAATESQRIVQRALESGINLIDTAEIYAFGRSERLVGRAIADRRDDVFIATKIFPVLPIQSQVVSRARRSARRLGVNRIDLYQLHFPNPLVPLSSSMRGMRKLLDAGVISHAGVSNYSLNRWRKAEAALGRPVLSNQVQYSLVARAPDRRIIPYAAANDRLVLAYSPLGQGLLSAKYSTGDRPGGVRARRFTPGNMARVEPLVAAIKDVAAAHGATPSQVALAWVIHHPNVVAIPGASSADQVTQNAAAADLELTADEFARLTAMSDRAG